MGKDNRGLTELTVTPLISRAVTVLRAAVPSQLIRAGAIGIHIGFTEFGRNREPEIEWAKSVRQAPKHNLQLTDAQEAAAWMLVGVATFYHELWGEACGATDTLTPQFRSLRDRFNQDVRRKLNVKMEGNVYDRYLHGSVTAYL